jgi:hypothetical protein
MKINPFCMFISRLGMLGSKIEIEQKEQKRSRNGEEGKVIIYFGPGEGLLKNIFPQIERQKKAEMYSQLDAPRDKTDSKRGGVLGRREIDPDAKGDPKYGKKSK